MLQDLRRPQAHDRCIPGRLVLGQLLDGQGEAVKHVVEQVRGEHALHDVPRDVKSIWRLERLGIEQHLRGAGCAAHIVADCVDSYRPLEDAAIAKE